MWKVVTASLQGRRPKNDDFVGSLRARRKPGNVQALIVCDGVASRPGSGDFARDVGPTVLSVTQRWVRQRRPAGEFHEGDALRLTERLRTVHTRGPRLPGAATTVALVVFRPGSVICVWAGDSRVYVLDELGAFDLMTTDHHDEDGRITRAVNSAGVVPGGWSFVVKRSEAPVLSVCVTSDGVHERCTLSELRHFAMYVMASEVRTGAGLRDALAPFIGGNVSDNMTMGLAYRSVSRAVLGQAVADLARATS